VTRRWQGQVQGSEPGAHRELGSAILLSVPITRMGDLGQVFRSARR
jgi:hypothetical protein